MAKNAEYDAALSADHEKVYISALKSQFLESKFFRHKFMSKKFRYNWKIEFAKVAEYDSA